MILGLIGSTIVGLAVSKMFIVGVDAFVDWHHQYMHKRADLFCKTLNESRTWDEWFESFDKTKEKLDKEYEGKWWFKKS